MTKNILLDGDIVIYEVLLACEEAWDWGDDIWTLHCDMKEARMRFDAWVADLMKTLDGDRLYIAYTGKTNWRKDVLPTYKSNRKKKRKPLGFPVLKQYTREVYTVCEEEGLEGDDILGLLAGMPRSCSWLGCCKMSADRVIVTIDKDLKTIPGKHYNPHKPEEGVVEVSLEDADRMHLTQALTGDSVDGYSGCPKVGPKTAERLLNEHCDWEQVAAAYANAGLSEQEALVQARVARILRWGEYDRKQSKVKLWNP
jgi:DNA polymerase-1